MGAAPMAWVQKRRTYGLEGENPTSGRPRGRTRISGRGMAEGLTPAAGPAEAASGWVGFLVGPAAVVMHTYVVHR